MGSASVDVAIAERAARTRTRSPAPRRVDTIPATVVEIDAKSLAVLGQWPWPRSTMADLIHAIAQYHLVAIGVDILMSEADRLSPEQVSRTQAGARSRTCESHRRLAIQRFPVGARNREGAGGIGRRRSRRRRVRARYCASPPITVADSTAGPSPWHPFMPASRHFPPWRAASNSSIARPPGTA